MKIFCTSFCNHGHDLLNGHPINHECYILNTKALRLEAAGDIDAALKVGIKSQPERILKPRHIEI